ncbi:hypothetical protein [Anaerobranca gottschalkii]|uniref:Nucleoside phosphorylase n=1 Tax=Anaerobranca gottschalkii DSM 13577 TaxID=1120990 RepID=A0A1H9ZXD1_9FIRM|nr:hypothetical protein [Anaerobranca gottschalkii]SES86432.1 Nucleoside phosphorylase [Anaerobranca gottschalkii DSM 13577]
MIFISTAMYVEAQKIIKKLRLKRDRSINKFEVFKNDQITLIITGVGKVKSAVALTYILSREVVTHRDIYINFGICGTKDREIPKGEIFLCNKIKDNETKFTYYPDILLQHPFKERAIETFSRVVVQEEVSQCLVDMESSALYQAASVFLKPHQIFFVKVVSDYLNIENIDKEFILDIIDKGVDQVIEWINAIKDVFNYRREVLTKGEEELLKKVVENLKMSVTMENEVRKLMIYYKLFNDDLTEIIDKYLNIQCESKQEGKMYLAELKGRIIC